MADRHSEWRRGQAQGYALGDLPAAQKQLRRAGASQLARFGAQAGDFEQDAGAVNLFRKMAPQINWLAIIRHMAFKLSLVVLVYPPSSADAPGLDAALLQKANAWLQRRNAGFDDDLLVVGIGFEGESALATMVKPYGLGDAQLTVEYLDRYDDSYELGESMSRVVSRFRPSGAISIVNWKAFVENNAYPMKGWWWVGLESVDDEQASSLEVVIRNLVPDAFRNTTMTWAAILAACMDLNARGEDHEVYEAHMTALTLARWLNGFDAATENNFYDFSAADAISATSFDTMRLGFEAGHNHGDELGSLVYGEDLSDDDLGPALLLSCLRQRNAQVRDALSHVFGGNASLFWSLRTSILQSFTAEEFRKPANQAMDDLLNLRTSAEVGDLDRPWRFVTDGWIDFSEE